MLYIGSRQMLRCGINSSLHIFCDGLCKTSSKCPPLEG